MIIYNGYRPGETREWTAKPRKSDFGHSVVKWSVTRRGHDFSFRYAVTCECGKRYTSRTSMNRATDSLMVHRNRMLNTTQGSE